MNTHNTRPELCTVLQRTPPPAFADIDREEFDEFTERLALDILQIVLRALYGRETGEAVFAVLTGRAEKPNGELAPGVSRAAVSKTACRLLRGLGLPIERPENARTGRKATH
jgi:hypothetical protein